MGSFSCIYFGTLISATCCNAYVEKTVIILCVCLCMFMFLLVRELLNSGISPDLVNEDGLTALHQVRTYTEW